jgi:uncharacterized membrane protein
MATLTVWKFSSAYGADEAEYTLQQLQSQELIKVHDAAIVRWPAGEKKPHTRQLSNLKGAGALGGSFWGLLFGLLFFMPIVGMAVGATMGAVAGKLSNAGIDKDFVDAVRDKVTPGTSALFALTSDAVIDKVIDAFATHHAELIKTNLSAAQEQTLRDAFAES